MSFLEDHPNYQSYKEPSGFYYDEVPSSAWTELESLIAEAGGPEREALARVVTEIATKVRAGNIESSFAYDNIPYVVSRLRRKAEDGKFYLFMDSLALLCEDAELSIDALNEFLEDNRIGYVAVAMSGLQGIVWEKIGDELEFIEDDQNSSPNSYLFF